MQRIFQRTKPYLFALPAVAFVVLFTYYPFVKTMYNSLFSINSYGVTLRFLGLDNYVSVLTNKHFYNALLNSLRYTFIGVPCSMFVSLLLALLSNRAGGCSAVRMRSCSPCPWQYPCRPPA